MGDASEGLVDALARIEELMDQRAQEKLRVLNPIDERDPEQVRTLESLRLARTDFGHQLALSNNPRRRAQLLEALGEVERRTEAAVAPADNSRLPALLLQAVIVPDSKTAEGQLIASVALPWFEIVKLIQKDASAIWQIDPFKWEEIIAGAYKRAGFDVVLTPRSNDKGRDVIASTQGVGCVRFFDQVKAYGPHHVVPANDVRAMIGVLDIEKNVSKGIMTTTADFAPGVYKDENIQRFMPNRLELRPRDTLLQWLAAVAALKSV